MFVFVKCEKETCVYSIPLHCVQHLLHLAMFLFCFFINGPLKFWLQWHKITMDFNLNYYLLFIYRHDLYRYPKSGIKNDEIKSNDENLSFTSAKAVLSLLVSQQKAFLNKSQPSESECGTQQTDSTPSEQVDIDRFIYRVLYSAWNFKRVQ